MALLFLAIILGGWACYLLEPVRTLVRLRVFFLPLTVPQAF